MDKAERQSIQKLVAVLEEFRKLDPEMQVQVMLTFLQASLHEDKSMTELSRILDVSQSSASRNILAFTELNRWKQPGFNLLTYAEDRLGDARRKVVSLTAKGRGFIKRITSKLE
jgi:DNA-binding MarR family transcriptional regulator